MLRYIIQSVAKSTKLLQKYSSNTATVAASHISSRSAVLLDMDGKPVSAGIVIIGDEIVKGQVQDANSYFLSKRLHQLGVDVKAVITIPDELDTIGKYVKEFSSMYTYVITAGGIGPTHDDITYEAIAAAFGDQTAINDELEGIYRGHFKEKYTESHRKLAMIPRTAKLLGNKRGFPITHISNVFILPGVPKFLRLAFGTLENLMENPNTSYKTRDLYLNIDEMSVTSEIVKVSELFQGRVVIGSYPEWHNNYYRLRISLESTNENDLLECEIKLKEVIPSSHFVSYDKRPWKDSMLKLRSLTEPGSEIQEKLTDSLSTFEEALTRYKLEEICLGFNGGKDCTVLLHLW